jgi:hypothetical protein
MALVAGTATGCGSNGSNGRSPASATASAAPPAALLAQARPIGRGVRFQPPVTGRPIGPCTQALGERDGVNHLSDA